MLTLHERHGLSHRKLADLFNQLYLAETGVSVGRTWVRELLIREAHAALHRQRELKHRMPARLPRNRMWGIDTTCVTDARGTQHIVLGAIDHGSRLNLILRPLRRFNRWTFLGCLLLAIGEFGRPEAIKTDNHPVSAAAWCGRRCGGAAYACVIPVRRGLGKTAISNGCSGRSNIVCGVT